MIAMPAIISRSQLSNRRCANGSGSAGSAPGIGSEFIVSPLFDVERQGYGPGYSRENSVSIRKVLNSYQPFPDRVRGGRRVTLFMQPRASFRWLSRLDGWVNRVYTSRYNPLYHSGALTIALLLVLLVTGLYLLLFYRLGAPYASVTRMNDQVWVGRWVRGLHRFASDAAVIASLVHAFRMYAQRRTWGPRTLAWVSGVLLLAVILVSGWTGYVLVWDS